jgi:rSAM/selenodomain-associated transferase 2
LEPPVAPELSIVIPVYREAELITGRLGQLAGASGIERCEIVVVDGDGGSTQTPTDITPVTVIQSAAGRGTQLNAGAEIAKAENLLFLHVDTELPCGFVASVISGLESFPAGAFDLRIASRSFVVRVISLVGCLRSRLTRVPYGDQAQFIRREVFHALGGFPDVPIMEDVALMDALKEAGHRICFLRPPARTSDRRWRKEGGLRATLRNWRLMMAYRRGTPPDELARSYRPHSEGGE